MLYDGTGKIVLFTTNQIGQQFMFASDVRLKNFIDVAGGLYWSTSKGSPRVYGEYLSGYWQANALFPGEFRSWY